MPFLNTLFPTGAPQQPPASHKAWFSAAVCFGSCAVLFLNGGRCVLGARAPGVWREPVLTVRVHGHVKGTSDASVLLTLPQTDRGAPCAALGCWLWCPAPQPCRLTARAHPRPLAGRGRGALQPPRDPPGTLWTEAAGQVSVTQVSMNPRPPPRLHYVPEPLGKLRHRVQKLRLPCPATSVPWEVSRRPCSSRQAS